MLRDWLRIKRFVEKELPRGPGIVCVDLDSVLLYHHTDIGISRLGRPLPFGLKLCDLLRARGKTIVVLTSRPADQHRLIFDFLNKHNFGVTDVTNVKPPAQAYFDDRAVRVRKNWE